MKKSELIGKVQTVLGVIDTNSLGVTLFHEHLLADMGPWFIEPTEASERRLANQPVTLENLQWVRTHRFNNKDNLQLVDEKVAIKEALLYKSAGGDTIVEVSSIGLSRDPLGLARISRATGLNVIMGSAYYIGASHPPELASKTEKEITNEIVRDIVAGIGDTGVHAGVIGEIGCSLPLEDGERKVLRASAAAQRITGAALIVHPSPDDDLALEIIEILGDAGADLGRTIISHVDLWGYSMNTCRRLMDAGCYIGYDNFGHLGYPHLLQGRLVELKGDLERISAIIQLISEGYLNKILISQDHCFKDCLTSYGGYGYAHMLNNVIRIMRIKGFTVEQIHKMLVDNPKRAFQLVPVENK
jgi:phosphotriesterase-related protein